MKSPWVRNIFILDNVRKLDEYTFKRLQIINFLSYVGSLTLLVFIATLDTTTEAILRDAVTIVFFLGLNILARYGKHPEVAFQLGMAVFVSSATYALLSSSAQRAVMWAPVYPFIAYLFLQMKGVVQWSVIALMLNVSLVFLSGRGYVELMVDTKIILYATVLNVVSSIILVGYQSVSGSYEKRVAEQQEALRTVNKELKNELENGNVLAGKLSIANEKSTHDLGILFRTKTAMLSILDDAKEFQEQLEKEKASVERKVKNRTAQLSKQRANLRASIEGLSSGYLMVSGEAKNPPVYNSAFLHIIDIYTTDSRALGVSEIYAKLNKVVSRKNILKDKVKNCIEAGKPFHIAQMTIGHSIVFTVEGSPIRLPETGEIIGCVMLFTDMTEAKELERSKNEFISIASHELRTPLTAIRGNATMLKDVYGSDITDPDAVEMVEDIKDASVRLISVVNGFLDMSRIEQNKVELDIVSTNPSKQITAAIEVLSNLADQKGMKIISEIPDSTPNILADSQRFLEIMSNLIDNAIKYSDKGDITLKCEIEKGAITFLVIDNGKGIPEESKRHLFKKFRQAGNNIYTRDVSRSTGLGLYICKMLAKQMSGEVFLESSEEGKGSTFALKLPIDARNKKR